MSTIREMLTKWSFDIDDKGLDKLDTKLKTLTKTAAVVATGLFAATGYFIKKAGEFEQTSIAFETMIGNAEEASKLLADLAQFAIKTPFTLTGIEKSAKQLMAMGIETDNLLPTLKSLGDVAAGLSVPLDRLAYNYGQVKAQGSLTGMELRDFARAGVPVIAELARNLGVAQNAIKDMVSAGSIGFKEVEQAFTTMTQDGGRFANLMIKQSKSLLGIGSNIIDYLQLMSRHIGLELLPQAKDLAKQFLAWVEANKELLKTNMISFFKKVMNLAVTLAKGIFRILNYVIKLTDAFGGLEKVVEGLLRLIGYFLALKFVMFVGTLTRGIIGLTIGLGKAALGFKLVGHFALLAQAQIFLIGTAIIALVALVEDFYGMMQGKKSVLGDIFGINADSVSKMFTKKGISQTLMSPITNLLGKAMSNNMSFLGGTPSTSTTQSKTYSKNNPSYYLTVNAPTGEANDIASKVRQVFDDSMDDWMYKTGASVE